MLQLLERLSFAERTLGRLEGITMLLPRQELFLYIYVRKKAVLSSQIEGIQSTLTDLLRFETEAASGETIDEIREVSNYVDAMTYGLERLNGFPQSLRLIREMHARRLQSGRGGTTSPGEFRRTQNWIGGSRPGKHSLYLRPSPSLKPASASWNALLQEVRENGNWESWLDFFLAGVADTANQAFEAATQIVDLSRLIEST